MDTLRSKHCLSWLVMFAGVSRQGYYKWQLQQDYKAGKQLLERDIKNHILAIHNLRPFYGYPRVTDALRDQGYRINHKRVYRLMRELNIQSRIRKKRRFFGTKSSIIYPNRLARDFKASAPNQKWVTDITYLPFHGRFVYLSAIQDLYNNEIIAFHVSERNDLALVLATLDKATKKTDVTETLIHSDQGFQYTSASYNKRLEQSGMIGSHSRKGNCLDNACIESFFSHLKTEMLYIFEYMSFADLYQALDDYIHFYNYERFQKRLGHRSPIQYRKTMAA